MIQVRFGLFETNSSSVHLLVIPKSSTVHIPDHVYLRGGEYGWEVDEYYDTIDYFYQACKDSGSEELKKFFSYLDRKGITYEESKDPRDDGYVDHENEIPFEELFGDESLLDRFLFSDAFVVTGNDNSEGSCPEDTYGSDYIVLEKGN